MMREEHFIGRASKQVAEFMHDEVHPLLKRYAHVSIYKALVFV